MASKRRNMFYENKKQEIVEEEDFARRLWGSKRLGCESFFTGDPFIRPDNGRTRIFSHGMSGTLIVHTTRSSQYWKHIHNKFPRSSARKSNTDTIQSSHPVASCTSECPYGVGLLCADTLLKPTATGDETWVSRSGAPQVPSKIMDYVVWDEKEILPIDSFGTGSRRWRQAYTGREFLKPISRLA
ncbi:hypothetical protein AAG570_002685 [Ranatra chinensis]|uniref:Uncharacterized protein n=1 Tax=Ranatra chinensis TaxID=642074 RepID=A0ABD0Y975_9HEMI